MEAHVPRAQEGRVDLHPVAFEPLPAVRAVIEAKRGRPLPPPEADLLSGARRKLTSLHELRMAVPTSSPGGRNLMGHSY